MGPLQPCMLAKPGLCREQAQLLPGPCCPTSLEDTPRPAAAVSALWGPEQAPRALLTQSQQQLTLQFLHWFSEALAFNS